MQYAGVPPSWNGADILLATFPYIHFKLFQSLAISEPSLVRKNDRRTEMLAVYANEITENGRSHCWQIYPCQQGFLCQGN